MTMLRATMHEFLYQDAIEPRLRNALVRAGAADDFYIGRGPNENASDFVVRTHSGQDAFVIEVKKTRQDVNSRVCWNQARRYAFDSQNWVPGIPRFFSITNGELLNVFCIRTDFTYIDYCLLQNGIRDLGQYGPGGEADEVLGRLEDEYTQLFADYLVHRSPLRYDNYWYPILDSFRVQVVAATSADNTPVGTTSIVREDGSVGPQSTASDLVFKALAYEIIRTLLSHVPSGQIGGVRLRPLASAVHNGSPDAAALASLYDDILGIDFGSLFGEPSTAFNLARLQCGLDDMPAFLQRLGGIGAAQQELADPEFLISSVVDTTLSVDFKHRIGLAVEDSALANVLSELCIHSPLDQVIDITAGTGALLGSSYDRLALLGRDAQQETGHAAIMGHLAGIEKDAFVASIGALRMILKNPIARTEPFMRVTDAFLTDPGANYDVLVCNPPYRRSTELSRNDKELMLGRLRAAYCAAASGSQFPFPSGQADLYMYFVEWGMLFLRPGGQAGWILSDKFLSTRSGQSLKTFLLEHCVLDAIVRYPGNHFGDFDVTTCFVLAHRVATGETPPAHDAKFLRFYRGADIDLIPEWLGRSRDAADSEATLKTVSSADIDPEENWLRYTMVTPRDYYQWIGNERMVPLEDAFDGRCRRGGDNGCKAFFFPYTNVPMRAASGEDPADVHERRAEYGASLREWLDDLRCRGFLKPALNNSWNLPGYYLDESTEAETLALVIPEDTNVDMIPSLSALIRLAESTYSDRHGVVRSNLDGKPLSIPQRETVSRIRHPWYSYYSARPMCEHGLVFPRSSRDLFKVLIPHVPYYFSTNFIQCDCPAEQATGIAGLEFAECIGASIMSSLGQLQCEQNGTWREGLLKLEEVGFYKVRVLDPRRVSPDQRNLLVAAFRSLSYGLTGLEQPDFTSPRFALDTLVLRILGTPEDNRDSVMELERTLRENVKDRRETPSDDA